MKEEKKSQRKNKLGKGKPTKKKIKQKKRYIKKTQFEN